jgi:gamma-tubulin complex component 2
MIFNECKLMDRLDSMKHYFFMDRGDFFAHLVDGSEDLFEKASEQVSKEKLESYLEMAIRTSSVRTDVYRDDVSSTLMKLGISEQLFVTKVTSGQAFGQGG